VCLSLYTIAVHNTAQNSSDNLSANPPDNHHSSGIVYQKGVTTDLQTADKQKIAGNAPLTEAV